MSHPCVCVRWDNVVQSIERTDVVLIEMKEVSLCNSVLQPLENFVSVKGVILIKTTRFTTIKNLTLALSFVRTCLGSC